MVPCRSFTVAVQKDRMASGIDGGGRVRVTPPFSRGSEDYGRGFHEKAGLVKTFFSHPSSLVVADQREAPRALLSPFLVGKVFVFPSPDRLASIRTLSRSCFAPVPVGVLNSKSGAAISVPNCTLPFPEHARSAPPC